MTISISTRTEVIDGKGYPLTITRIRGIQQIYFNGKPKWVSEITYHDALGTCAMVFTRYLGPTPPPSDDPPPFPPAAAERMREVAARR